jgi:transcriptional regulator with XRE-family HTH domain
MATRITDEGDGPAVEALCAAVGVRVRELRTRMGLSQVELSARSGIKRGYVYEIERLGVNLSLKLLFQLANALGVKVSDLVSESGDTSRGKNVDLAVLREKVLYLQERNADLLKTIDEALSSSLGAAESGSPSVSPDGHAPS